MSKNQKPINIDYRDENGERFQGTFIIKRLSIMDSLGLEARKIQLNGGYYHDSEKPGVGVPESLDNVNHMIAHLEASIVKAPNWWNLSDLNDFQIITKVFEEVTAYENSFRRRKSDQDQGQVQFDESGAGGGSAQSEASNNSVGAAKMVGKEVSAALEP